MSLVNRVEAFLKQISFCSVHYFPWKWRQKKIIPFWKRSENSGSQQFLKKINEDICKKNCVTPSWFSRFASLMTQSWFSYVNILSHLQQDPSVVYYSKQYHDCFQCTRHIWLFLPDSYFCTDMQPLWIAIISQVSFPSPVSKSNNLLYTFHNLNKKLRKQFLFQGSYQFYYSTEWKYLRISSTMSLSCQCCERTDEKEKKAHSKPAFSLQRLASLTVYQQAAKHPGENKFLLASHKQHSHLAWS